MKTEFLNGLWSFQPDPDRTGKSQGVLQPDHPFPEQIEVPGSWRLNPRYRDYHGAAWYKRTFRIEPEDLDLKRCIQIVFGGVFRYADVYVNENLIGRHGGYQSSFRFDITDQIVAGNNTIAVMADDVQDRSFDIMGGAACMEVPQVLLAGIYEPVRLEISEPVFITDIYAPLDMRQGQVHLELTTANRTGRPAEADIAVEFIDAGDRSLAASRSDKLLIAGESAISNLTFPASDFILWTPEQPHLYEIRITLTANGRTDIFTQRTGFKQLEARGTSFFLNGEPYFLCGYGDDFVFPATSLPSATDPHFYKRPIERAKQYGFNAARHHSHFPYEAYLDAADELGLLVQPELAMANLDPGAFNAVNEKLFLSEWQALILEKRHHPCIMAWCGGNEEEWGYPFDDKIYAAAKALDPYRLATITDGTFTAREVDSVHDYASLCYAESTDTLPLGPFADLYRRDRSGKPQLVHEMGNFTTLPQIQDLPAYRDAVIYPQKLQDFADFIQAGNLETLYRRCFANALTLSRICHKVNIEQARLAPDVSGYHIWTFTDYYDTTQGIVNPFYEDKAFTPESFRVLNAQSVLLWDSDRYVFSAGEPAALAIKVSYYPAPAGRETREATLTLALSDGQEKTVKINLDGTGILPLYTWEVCFPSRPRAEKLQLQASLQCGDQLIRNEWNLWVYPELAVPEQKIFFINYLSRYLIDGFCFMYRHFTIPMPMDERHLIITGFIYNGMLEAVNNGATLLLLALENTFRATLSHNAFRSSWWMQQSYFYLNRSSNLQTSNVLEDHPALAGIPHESCWDLNFYNLVDDRHAVRIDELGLDAEPIIFGIDAQLRRHAYLFEMACGKGRILVSTLNFEPDNLRHPEVAYTFRSLVNYCQSADFRPGCQVSLQSFRDALQ
ncbi:MAG TPA: hypothetical protein DD640_07365 [Clostridiales bacterium]|nr:hypothetical protein [Clostridiales bacterium]